MKNIKNENGISLVIVLLITVVFAVLGLAIIGLSLSNMKQINVSETKLQSVELAEMGITYYETALQNIVDKTEDEMASISIELPKNESLTDEEYEKLLIEEYKEETVKKLKNNIEASLLLEKIEKMNVISKDRFEAEAETPFEDPVSSHTLIIKLTSKGFRDYEKSTSTINSEVKISIENLTIPTTTGSNIDYQVSIVEPKVNNKCTKAFGSESCRYFESVSINNSIGQLNKTEIVVEGALSSNANFNGGIQNDSTLYIKGSATFNQSIGSIKKSNIFIGGAAYFRNINDIQNDSVFVIRGEANFTEPFDLNKSTIFVDGKAAFKNINNMQNDSKIIVNGDTKFTGPISSFNKSTIFIGNNAEFKNINGMQNDSKIIVNGNANFTEPIDNFNKSAIYVNGNANFFNKHINNFHKSAKICVKGQITGIPSNTNYNIFSFLKDEKSYKQNCSLNDSTETPFSLKLNSKVSHKYQ
ncbi:pilus assembly PilX N-terminal domain-containing protein [Metabacillus fastidiosus]|uniref:pilus assembly PilX N-terminal domain-containing protein n=1 Tax=Metabacillus fastidiosus TaxID=1458 RepID=UPI003D276888